jgi:hypothetical protein
MQYDLFWASVSSLDIKITPTVTISYATPALQVVKMQLHEKVWF